ncbi:MAG TPA: hypothetical protein VLI66_03760 [Terrabacter sp.]|nr:hypothetical protein [Terrabacter sp.]
MSAGLPPSEGHDTTGGLTPSGGPALRRLLGIRPFRNLFAAGAVSSFGDWLALLATTALATELAPGGSRLTLRKRLVSDGDTPGPLGGQRAKGAPIVLRRS